MSNIPSEFSFKSKVNPYGILYKAHWNGLQYEIKWPEGYTKMSKAEMEKRLANGDFKQVGAGFAIQDVVRTERHIVLSENCEYEIKELLGILSDLEGGCHRKLDKPLGDYLESCGIVRKCGLFYEVPKESQEMYLDFVENVQEGVCEKELEER